MAKLVAPPIKPPSKPPDNLAHLRPEMPQIPGLNKRLPSASTSASDADSTRVVQIGGLAATVLVMGVAILWWVKSASHGASDRTSSETATAVSSPPPALAAEAPATEGPTVAATGRELAKPWSAKQFTFVRPSTHDNITAMVIRLPGGGLWAFAIQEPYGHCDLEFVSDLTQLSKRYGYHASHPMVASPCTSTVYDPLKIGSLGDNIWARGEIVQGGGLRPPISIDVLEKTAPLLQTVLNDPDFVLPLIECCACRDNS